MGPERQARTGSDAVSRDPYAGRVLDRRYEIIERIARGGMASVYTATDLRLDRLVAVKIMHPGLGDDTEFAARFVGEARAAARLSHPNVVSVFDQGEDDGTVFLAMELIHGHTLRDAISQKSPLSPLHAIALLDPVVAALAAAHKAGLIHRDVKPENVLIAEDGRVKVADFGLAKAMSSMTQHTATGMLIGTVSYVAPEIVTEGRSDARGDVYAVGVILYELLTGSKPHTGETPIQIAYRHVHHDVPAPSAAVPGIPAYVDALVARATARDPELRPTDARVLKHQFDQVRHALATGAPDDPRLTADLLPRRSSVHLDTQEIVPAPSTSPPTWTPPPPGADRTAVRPVPPPARAPEPEVEDEVDDDWEHHALEALFGSAAEEAHAPVAAAGPEPTSRFAVSSPAPPVAARPTRAARPARPEPTRAAAPPTPPREHPAPAAERPRRRRRRGPVLLVLCLVVALAVGGGAYYLGYARYTMTPGVLGLTQAAAEEKLDGEGLGSDIDGREYSDTVEEGAVISSDPGPGDRILHDGQVGLTLSLGAEVYDVPVLKGLTEDQAQDALAAANLAFGTSTQAFSEKVDPGIVISSDPKVGATLRPGSPVDLVVSKGREPIKVGDWTGKTADTAQAQLERRGLVAAFGTRAYSDTVPEGRVISQDPPAPATRYRGQSVTLVVSRGPELVAIPDGLVASGVASATAALQAAGFEVKVVNSAQYVGLGFVIGVSPGQGERVPKGSVVTLDLV